MKKLALITAAVAALAVGSPDTLSAEELRYSLFVPSRSLEFEALDGYFKELGEATGGEVTGKIYPGGQLLSAPATLKGISDGTIDMGFVIPAFTPSELRHVNMLPDLVGYTLDAEGSAAAANEAVMLGCESCKADFEDRGATFLGGHGSTPWQLMCADEAATLEDLKGRRVRSTGGPAIRLVESLGMVSVQMPVSEISSALAGGQIDCAVGPVSWLEAYSLWDSIEIVLDMDLGISAGIALFTVNSDKLAAMSEENRATFINLIPKHLSKLTYSYINQAKEVREMAEGKGVKFVQPTDEMKAALESYRAGDIENITQGMIDRGIENPREMIDAHLKRLEKWTKMLDESGRGDQAYEDLMRAEIYDKYQAAN